MDMFFRPPNEPAQTFYDALMDEAKHRKSKTCDEWIEAERLRMWREARDYAQQHELQVPTILDVKRVESSASGHCDYVAKFAYGLTELLRADV